MIIDEISLEIFVVLYRFLKNYAECNFCGLLGVRHVTFDQWERIAAYEAEMGAKKNKLADKVLSVQKMLEIAWS